MHPGHALRRAALLVLVPLATLGWTGARAVERAGLEAAIVYHILLFVEWPGEAALPAGTPLVVCLDAASPLVPELRALEGRPVRQLKLAVRALGAGEPARACSVTYVDSEAARKALVDRRPADGATLVIAGSTLGDGTGPMVRLGEASGRLVFDIDVKAAREAGLVVSSRLLRLARKVSE